MHLPATWEPLFFLFPLVALFSAIIPDGAALPGFPPDIPDGAAISKMAACNFYKDAIDIVSPSSPSTLHCLCSVMLLIRVRNLNTMV